MSGTTSLSPALSLASAAADAPGLPTGLLTVAYLLAGVLFILSLGGLSAQASARRGNLLGIVGMLLAVGITAAAARGGYVPLLTALGVGGAIGALLAARVAMTSMPELVAVLHSFVGLAAVLVGIASYLDPGAALFGVELHIHEIEIFLGVFVGAVTFTGSIIAFGKLRGKIRSKPLLLPGRHVVNLLIVGGSIYLGARFVAAPGIAALPELLVMTGLASVLGIHLVMAIGGADMPVVVSMLNSYSGWAAAATGFMLSNDLLIVTGALVGSSGAILSYIMCKAMNRGFLSVIAGGFGAEAAAGGGEVREQRPWKRGSAEDAAYMLKEAESVIIIPGYGMAVAQAQHVLREMGDQLKAAGVNVKYAIHPVAGRMPGHMNVLLAEANVPYDEVFELEDIQSEFATADVAFIIGANDVVNPAAKTDKSSPIYGMPVFDVDKAKQVFFIKRSMGGVGYAGVDNDVFYMPQTTMLLADAKKMVEDIVKALAH